MTAPLRTCLTYTVIQKILLDLRPTTLSSHCENVSTRKGDTFGPDTKGTKIQCNYNCLKRGQNMDCTQLI